MQVQRSDSDDKPVHKEKFTYVDLYKFESPSKYSSLGKSGLSTLESAPVYGFGTSTRQKQGKVYQSEELSKTQFIGKTSPGPKYEVRDTDKYSYKQDPTWTMGKQARETLGMGPKHAYYTRMDMDFDPATADSSRKPHAPIVKIGLESRFPNEKKQKGTPGPEYDPKIKPEVPNSPQYSFGVRREIQGQSALILPSSTPKQVGPGSYSKPDQVNTSTMSDHPKWSFTKDPKHKSHNNDVLKHHTFDTRSAFGSQASSKNKSGSQVSFGKAKKDYQTGIFKDMMATQATSVRIAMPRF